MRRLATWTTSVVGLRLTAAPAALRGRVTSVTSASAADCCHSSTMPASLSDARCALAMSQIACSNAAPCSSGSRPLIESSRRPRVQTMLSARRAYSAWSSATTGGTILRAASAISLGGLPIASRASRASLSAVANSAAAATWSSVNEPTPSARSSAGSSRSAALVRVIRTAVRWSLREICANHCALEEHPAAAQSPSSSASRTISVTRCASRACCAQSDTSSARRASRRPSSASGAPVSISAANMRSTIPARGTRTCAGTVPNQAPAPTRSA